MQQNHIPEMVSHLFRERAGKMTAALIKIFGFESLQLIEDVVQDTFLAAHQQWNYNNLPDCPEAWLMTVARNKAINAVKHGARIKNMDHSVFVREEEQSTNNYIDLAFTEKETTDNQLKLLFLCCHPTLPDKSQIILTLQVLCGFSLDEIANGLFMQKEAVKKTLLRAKQQIRETGLHTVTNYVLFSNERSNLVLQVIYLMFNEGYKTTEDRNVINIDLCFEAIRLCKLLLSVKKDHIAEALMALMFFSIARFPSRVDEDGNIVLLEDQDRTKWNQQFIKEGFYYLEQSRAHINLSRYHLEAGIAAVHCSAVTYSSTDWKKITFYYDQLIKIDSSSVIKIHRAIAVAHAENLEKGLTMLNEINQDIVDGYYLFHATKANLLYKAKRYEEARKNFELALTTTKSGKNKTLIHKQLQNWITHLNDQTHDLL